MVGIRDYIEYKELYADDLVVAVRNLLRRIEDKGDYELEDSKEHNALITYFNKFGLHKKLTKQEVDKW